MYQILKVHAGVTVATEFQAPGPCCAYMPWPSVACCSTIDAGDSDEPSRCIGNARRMMVHCRHQQASIMIEAVMNHVPEVC